MIQQWPQVGSVVEKCRLPGGLGFRPGSLSGHAQEDNYTPSDSGG